MCGGSYTYTDTRKRVGTMAKKIMAETKSAAIRAFLNRQREFFIHGIKLRFEHAYGRYHQCLLPDGGEVFRMVRLPGNRVAIMDV